jgi:hypothetical protein
MAIALDRTKDNPLKLKTPPGTSDFSSNTTRRTTECAPGATSMTKSKAAILALAVLVAPLGCNDNPTDPGAVNLTVRTGKAAYSLTADTAADAVLLNDGPTTVYAPMNEYVYVERLVDGKWRNRNPWFSVDGTSISFPIAPGDSLIAYPMSFGYVDRVPGTYRFVFEVALDSEGRRLVTESKTASRPFELRP